MHYTVYKVTNKLNGKYYIGKHQTLDLDDGYMGSGIMIRRAIKKHGKDNFKKEILHVFDNEEDMNNKEAEIVVVSEETYNLCDGGKGGWSYVNKQLTYENRKDSGIKGGYAYVARLNIDEKFRKVDSNIKSERAKKRYANGTLSGFSQNKDTLNELRARANSPLSILKRKNTFKEINHQKGIKNSQHGTMWIYHDKLGNKKIKKELLPEYLNEGWQSGRKF